MSHLTVPAEFFSQWDDDAGASKAYDCAPTCAKMVIDFYTDAVLPIAQLRDEMLGPGAPGNIGVGGPDLARVLDAHGIPSFEIAQDASFDQLLSWVRQGRYPILFLYETYLVGRQDPGTAFHAFWLVDISADGMVATTFDPDVWGDRRGPTTYAVQALRLGWETDAHGGVVPNAAKEEADVTPVEVNAAIMAALANYGLTDPQKLPSVFHQLDQLAHHKHETGEPTPAIQP